MIRDYAILTFAWLLTIALLIKFVPLSKLREAQVIFLFKQAITWFVGLLVVDYGLITYPVRLFPRATLSSFSFEYFIYPSICVLFNLYYPIGTGIGRQLLYYSYYCSVMTFLEVLCVKYTNLIRYPHWTWYITWITLFITFYMSRKYYLWFFKIGDEEKTGASQPPIDKCRSLEGTDG